MKRIFEKLILKAEGHTPYGLVDGNSKNTCSLLYILVKKNVLFPGILHRETPFERRFFFFSSSLFNFSENENLKCSEAILHLFQYHILPIIVWDSFCTAPDQSLPIPVIPCRRAPCPARATEPGGDTVLPWEEMPAQGTGNTHGTPRHATCPSHWRLRPQVFSQANSIYSFERSIWLSLAAPQKFSWLFESFSCTYHMV